MTNLSQATGDLIILKFYCIVTWLKLRSARCGRVELSQIVPRVGCIMPNELNTINFFSNEEEPLQKVHVKPYKDHLLCEPRNFYVPPHRFNWAQSQPEKLSPFSLDCHVTVSHLEILDVEILKLENRDDVGNDYSDEPFFRKRLFEDARFYQTQMTGKWQANGSAVQAWEETSLRDVAKNSSP